MTGSALLEAQRQFRPRVPGPKPTSETLFLALLVKAQREGKLADEALQLRITPALAEALLRRFPLFPREVVRPVEVAVRKYLAGDQDLEVVRVIAAEHRSHLLDEGLIKD